VIRVYDAAGKVIETQQHAGDLRSVDVLRSCIHRELVNCLLRFPKRSQLFIGPHNETLSVVAMRVCDPDRSPYFIRG
jgi:hypothetical protein